MTRARPTSGPGAAGVGGQEPAPFSTTPTACLGLIKRIIRFGVVAGQGAAGSLQQGLVTLVLDLRAVPCEGPSSPGAGTP
jgi:hypothetical protein